MSPSLPRLRYLWLVPVLLLIWFHATFIAAAPVRIMPLGDSITRGSHRAGAVPGGYRKKLANRLAAANVAFDFVGNRNDNPAAGIDPDHQGSDGFRTDQTLAIMSNWLARNPDVVLMKLGTNDMIQGRTINEAIGNLDQLITGILQNAPSRKVFVSSILPIVETRDGKTAAQWDVIIREYNTRVRQLVSSRAGGGANVHLVEMHGSVDPSTAFLSTDGTHPGPAGYDRMGDVWFEAIRSHLGAGPPGSPVAGGDAYQGVSGSALVVSSPGVLANDSSPSGAPLAAALATAPPAGSLSLSSNGGFTYTPPAGFVGSTSFTYTASDGTGTSPPATVNLDIRQAGALRNGGFESDLANWTATGTASIKSASPYSASEGGRLVAFNSGNTANGATVSQTFSTVAGTTYELSFDYGVLAYNNDPQVLGVEIRGASLIRSENYSVRRLTANVRWESAVIGFTANSSATTLTFTDRSATTNGLDLTLDNVRVTGTAAPVTRRLAVSSLPSDGAAVVLTAADTTGAKDGATPFERIYQDGSSITLTAAASHGGRGFEKWRKDGADLTGNRTVTISLAADTELTAVYVDAPPVITRQPGDVAATEGASAAFSVEAGGQGTISYQWRRDGNPISGATDPVFAIGSVSPADEGNYDVVVSNHVGSSTSRTATLTLRTAGAFDNGSFESGFEGWTASGNIAIQGNPPYIPTDGTKLVNFNGGNTVPNAVLGRSFTTAPGVSYELEFDYGVLSYANTSQTLAVEIDGNARLAATSMSIQKSGSANVRWLTGSLPFVADSSLTTLTFRDVSQSTNGLDLLLDNVRLVAQVTRRLVVSSAPSAGAVITVMTPSGTVDEAAPFERLHPDGERITLTTAPALNGLRFQKWTRDGADAGTAPELQIVMNSDVSITAHYVDGPPVIIEDPVDTLAVVGEDVTFTVVAEGTGTLVYQWRRNGDPIDGEQGDTLALASVGEADEGVYDVVVSNGMGSTVSAAASLDIATGAEFANGSFEEGFAGWTVTGNVSIQDGSPYTSVDGARLVAFNNGNTTPNGTLSRSFTTVAGREYELLFHFGVLAYNNSSQRLDVSLVGSGNLASASHMIQRRPGSIVHWESRSLRFVADSAVTTLTFHDRSTATNALDLTIDHVRVSPVSMARMSAVRSGSPDSASTEVVEEPTPEPVLEGTPCLSVAGSCVEIGFEPETDAVHEVHRSVNLRDWEVIKTFGPGEPIRCVDDSPPEGGAFYRIARPE